MRVLDDWLLTAERVAVHLPSATAVLADPHLGYAHARRRSGEAVPGDSLDEQLSGLLSVRRRLGVRRLVIAGDLLEEGGSHTVLTAFGEWLNHHGFHLTAVVPGNHDLPNCGLRIADCGFKDNPQSAIRNRKILTGFIRRGSFWVAGTCGTATAPCPRVR